MMYVDRKWYQILTLTSPLFAYLLLFHLSLVCVFLDTQIPTYLSIVFNVYYRPLDCFTTLFLNIRYILLPHISIVVYSQISDTSYCFTCPLFVYYGIKFIDSLFLSFIELSRRQMFYKASLSIIEIIILIIILCNFYNVLL